MSAQIIHPGHVTSRPDWSQATASARRTVTGLWQGELRLPGISRDTGGPTPYESEALVNARLAQPLA